MRRFYVAYAEISPTLLAKSEMDEQRISPTVSAKFQTTSGNHLTIISEIAKSFPLPWSHYDKPLALDDENARRFYEERSSTCTVRAVRFAQPGHGGRVQTSVARRSHFGRRAGENAATIRSNSQAA